MAFCTVAQFAYRLIIIEHKYPLRLIVTSRRCFMSRFKNYVNYLLRQVLWFIISYGIAFFDQLFKIHYYFSTSSHFQLFPHHPGEQLSFDYTPKCKLRQVSFIESGKIPVTDLQIKRKGRYSVHSLAPLCCANTP